MLFFLPSGPSATRPSPVYLHLSALLAQQYTSKVGTSQLVLVLLPLFLQPHSLYNHPPCSSQDLGTHGYFRAKLNLQEIICFCASSLNLSFNMTQLNMKVFFLGFTPHHWTPESFAGLWLQQLLSHEASRVFHSADGALSGGGTKQMRAAIFKLCGRGTGPGLRESRKGPAS